MLGNGGYFSFGVLLGSGGRKPRRENEEKNAIRVTSGSGGLAGAKENSEDAGCGGVGG